MITAENRSGRCRLAFVMIVLSITPRLLMAAPETIRPGEVWPDDRGKHVQAHGGGMMKQGELYYWFGDDRSQGMDHANRYVSCYSSKDLAHWMFRNQVIKLSDPEN